MECGGHNFVVNCPQSMPSSRRERSGANMETFTSHAEARVRQRGIRHDALDVLLDRHDTLLFAGAGRVSVALSRRGGAGLVAEGYPPGTVEAARRLVAVVEDDTGTVVTVLWCRGREARRHRRQMDTFKRRRVAA